MKWFREWREWVEHRARQREERLRRKVEAEMQEYAKNWGNPNVASDYRVDSVISMIRDFDRSAR